MPHLFRKRVYGERILLADVQLKAGCHVDLHNHESEQIAYIVSGKVKWTLGAEGSPERREVVLGGGSILHLPSNFPHGVDAIEDTHIIDLLSPPGEMGVDRQRS